jgi:hypothetical protein
VKSLRPASALFAILALASAAQAAPLFIASPPVVDRDSGEMVLLVGGVSEDGTTLKPSAIEVEIDGEHAPPPKSVEVFSEFAQTAAEASQAWKSPLSVGLVYLWVKDVPAGTSDAILEGIGGFFRRIPARTNVYATLYGRKRQPIPKLKASEIGGQLHDLGYIPGDRPNFADALRVDLKTLLSDESPFKVLLAVTDGRDFTDPSGEGSADFGALADQIDKTGVKLLVVSLPPPEADAEQSAKNLTELAGSGAFRRATDQPLEVQSTLESLGQSIADMRRVHLELPWGWRNFGGTHKVRLYLTTDGKRRAIEVGKVTVPAGMPWLLILAGILVGVLLVVVVVVLILRLRSREDGRRVDDEDEQPVVSAAHALIQRGLSAQRALVELTRGFPRDVASLAQLDASVFSDDRYPVFKTKAGRRRFEELQALLSRKSNDDTLLGGDLAEVLSQSISSQTPPDQVASSIAARVPEDQWSAFSRLGLDELARALRASGARHPVLATPRARGVALEIQAALRSESRSTHSLSLGWLVRAAGQGRRGETLRLPSGRAVLGCGAACEIRLEADSQIADQHAAISERRGAFSIEPLQGVVKVETVAVNGRQPLGDGDTIEMGQSRYVFKCVSTGNVGNSRTGV